MTAMANTITDRMDPVLDLLNQRPREDWSWNFEPDTLGHSAVNALALCNAALLTYSDSASVRRFLSKWQFPEVRILPWVPHSSLHRATRQYVDCRLPRHRTDQCRRRRLCDHDLPNGYLRRLERQLRSGVRIRKLIGQFRPLATREN